MNRTVTRIIVIAAACLALVSCLHVGVKRLHFEIEVDDQVVLTGARGVRDDTPAERMWDVLPDVPFEVAEDAGESFKDTDQDTRTLQGKVVVRMLHARREVSTATLSELTITRSAEGGGWSIGEAECNRVEEAITKH